MYLVWHLAQGETCKQSHQELTGARPAMHVGCETRPVGLQKAEATALPRQAEAEGGT